MKRTLVLALLLAGCKDTHEAPPINQAPTVAIRKPQPCADYDDCLAKINALAAAGDIDGAKFLLDHLDMTELEEWVEDHP